MMKKICLIMFAIFLTLPSCADKISGTVKKDEFSNKHQVIDAYTHAPISGANVSVPSKGIMATTDSQGYFELDTNIDKQTILSVKKDGYRQFSVTIDKGSISTPMKIGIEQAQNTDLAIDSSLHHIGDDNFSANSANSGDFKAKSIGPFYTKRFEYSPNAQGAVLIIGSIIGLDTKMAKELGQNAIASVYASPAEVFFNGQKIAELHLNGDNQEISVPSSLIKKNNEVTIKAGRNLFQHAYVDYDDIEIMNLRLETRSKFASEKNTP